jgi:hypothetical protein
LPSGCHEAAARAGTARDEEGGDEMTFSRNLRLVRDKVASRKGLSHEPCMSSIPAASTISFNDLSDARPRLRASLRSTLQETFTRDAAD